MNHIGKWMAGLGLLLAVAAPAPAVAGPFTDKMSICLVSKTSAAEKNLLVKWIFAALATHPEVSAWSKVSPAEGDKLNQSAAALLMTLLTDRCFNEAREAIQYEGAVAIQSSFSVLGQVAAQGLMSHPSVGAFVSGVEKYLDPKLLEKLKPAP
jgi:hypothetical protein